MNTQFDCKSTTHPDTPVTNIPSCKVCMPHPNLLADSTATDSSNMGPWFPTQSTILPGYTSMSLQSA